MQSEAPCHKCIMSMRFLIFCSTQAWPCIQQLPLYCNSLHVCNPVPNACVFSVLNIFLFGWNKTEKQNKTNIMESF